MLKKISIVTSFLVLFLSGNVFASWSFDLTTDYTKGDSQVTFDLVFSTDESVTMNPYGIEFVFDSSEIDFVSYTSTPPTGYFEISPVSVNSAEGTLDNFSGFGFAAASLAAGDYVFGSFTFNVVNEVEDGVTDFNFDYTDDMMAFGVNGTPVDSSVYSQYALSNMTDIASVAPVPVPAAVWLLGSGIAGLACFRRKQA